MYTRKLIIAAGFISGLLCSTATLANDAETGPTGYWQTIDLDKVPRSIVKISNKGDELIGKIIKVIPSKNQNEDALCDKCEGALKDKPIQGMRFLWGAKKELDTNKWGEGYILDTDSGSTYRCNLSTSEDGKILYLHAYVGAPIFGKTIEWTRVAAEDVAD